MAQRPMCFDSDAQWLDWRRLSRASSHRANLFCADCTLAYQQKMVQQGRCAFPETVFVRDKDGCIRGKSPVEKGWLGSICGHFSGTGKRSRQPVIAIGSPEAVLEEMRRRKTA